MVASLVFTAVLVGSFDICSMAEAKSSGSSGAWPKNPTAKQIRTRVGEYNWHKARRVAVCETGGRIDWYLDLKSGRPLGRYVSALGMYVSTFAYGQSQTHYRGSNWHQQVAIAVAAHRITGGWSGWGCGGA